MADTKNPRPKKGAVIEYRFILLGKLEKGPWRAKVLSWPRFGSVKLEWLTGELQGRTTSWDEYTAAALLDQPHAIKEIS